MPKKKKANALLTATERDRLVNRMADSNLSDEEKEKHQNGIYHNDMVVRNKIQSWLKQADDVIFALENLPIRKLKKELDDNDAYGLFWLGLKLLKILDFAPIENVGGVPVVSKPVEEIEENRKDSWVRRATENDFERNYTLELIKDELERKVSTNDLYKQYRFKVQTPGTGKWFYDNYDQEKQHHEAIISASDEIIKEDPDNADAWCKRGVALWCQGKCEEALENLDKAIILPSTYQMFFHAIGARGQILGELGRHAEVEQNALFYHIRMIECDPSDPYNYSGMGDHFYSRCRYKEAIECYEKAIELDPSNSMFWTNKGEALYGCGKSEKALQCFDKAIELKPSHPRPFEGKGKTLEALGRNDEARNCFQKAKELENKILNEL